MGRRKVDIVAVSDIHLRTFGYHADEFLIYLESIKFKNI
jgi:hypothetical protein|tara:strand:+ start:854 stop:970 length:117 start_codon:yes stop_codon:yes gene_type:complete